MNIELEVEVDPKSAIKQMEKVTKAAEKMRAELDKLQNLEVKIKVVDHAKKWWQFWK